MEGNQKGLEGNPPRRSIVLTKLIISQSIRKHIEDRGIISKHGRGSKTVTSEWSSNGIHKSSVQEVKKGIHVIWQVNAMKASW